MRHISFPNPARMVSEPKALVNDQVSSSAARAGRTKEGWARWARQTSQTHSHVLPVALFCCHGKGMPDK